MKVWHGQKPLTLATDSVIDRTVSEIMLVTQTEMPVTLVL